MANETARFITNVILTPKKPEATQQLYSQWAEKYDHDIDQLGCTGVHQLVKHFLDLNVPKTARILDVGAGTGAIGEILNKHGYVNVDALDGCNEMLEIARKKQCYKNLYQSFVTSDIVLPLDEKAYDVAIMSGVICPGHILPTAFGQIMRLVKKGKNKLV
jgi:ubiquinone/menaquinone biosynthesis C-methylase UbiE